MNINIYITLFIFLKIVLGINIKADGSCVTLRGTKNPQKCLLDTYGDKVIEGLKTYKIKLNDNRCLVYDGVNLIKGNCNTQNIAKVIITDENYQYYIIKNNEGKCLNSFPGGQVHFSGCGLTKQIYFDNEDWGYGISFTYNEMGPGGAIISKTGYWGFSTIMNKNTLSWTQYPPVITKTLQFKFEKIINERKLLFSYQDDK